MEDRRCSTQEANLTGLAATSAARPLGLLALLVGRLTRRLRNRRRDWSDKIGSTRQRFRNANVRKACREDRIQDVIAHVLEDYPRQQWTAESLFRENGALDHAVIRQLLTQGPDSLFGAWEWDKPPFLRAIKEHNVGVLCLLTRTGDLDAFCMEGRTPLFLAIYFKLAGVVEMLLDNGADPEQLSLDENLTYDSFTTPLIAAVRTRQVSVVKTLLQQHQVDANRRVFTFIDEEAPSGMKYVTRTPLFVASQLGDLALVQILLDHGAEVNRQDYLGFTPLMAASKMGHAKVVRFLLAKGADVHDSSDGHADIHEETDVLRPTTGATSLFLACEKGHLAIVKRLLSYGAEADVEREDTLTPLSMALHRGYDNVAIQLIKAGANVTRLDTNDWTPLHLASLHGRAEVVPHLLKRGANVNQITRDGDTPLMVTAYGQGDIRVARLLVESGANVTIMNINGWSAMTMASSRGNLQVVWFLWKKNAHVNHAGVPPLHAASEYGHENVTRMLLEMGACVDCSDMNGLTPLVLATTSNHVHIVELLLQNMNSSFALETEINRPLFLFGSTPFHFASDRGLHAMAELLLKYGADPSKQKSVGATLLSLAKHHGKLGLVELLRSAQKPTEWRMAWIVVGFLGACCLYVVWVTVRRCFASA